MAKSTAVLKYSSTKARTALGRMPTSHLQVLHYFVPLSFQNTLLSKIQGQDLSWYLTMQPCVIFTNFISSEKKRKKVYPSLLHAPCSAVAAPALSVPLAGGLAGFGTNLLGWEWKFCSSHSNFPKQNTFIKYKKLIGTALDWSLGLSNSAIQVFSILHYYRLPTHSCAAHTNKLSAKNILG